MRLRALCEDRATAGLVTPLLAPPAALRRRKGAPKPRSDAAKQPAATRLRPVLAAQARGNYQARCNAVPPPSPRRPPEDPRVDMSTVPPARLYRRPSISLHARAIRRPQVDDMLASSIQRARHQRNYAKAPNVPSRSRRGTAKAFRARHYPAFRPRRRHNAIRRSSAASAANSATRMRLSVACSISTATRCRRHQRAAELLAPRPTPATEAHYALRPSTRRHGVRRTSTRRAAVASGWHGRQGGWVGKVDMPLAVHGTARRRTRLGGRAAGQAARQNSPIGRTACPRLVSGNWGPVDTIEG